MKAAVLREFKQPLQWEEVETPAPGPNEVLVQIMACGIDGTDLKLLDGFGGGREGSRPHWTTWNVLLN